MFKNTLKHQKPTTVRKITKKGNQHNYQCVHETHLYFGRFRNMYSN